MKKERVEPIVVVGTIALDTVNTPFGTAERVPGGSALYLSVAASMFAPVKVVSVVGEDFTEELWAGLAHANVDLTGVATRPGRTFSWGGNYAEDVNIRQTTFTELGVLADFQPRLPSSYRACRTVCLANVDPEVQLKVLEAMDNPEFVVLDTMNLWIKGHRSWLEEVIARSSALILNDEEARMLTGRMNLVAAIGEIQKMGPGIVVVKKGEHGALLADGSDLFAVPGYPLREVRDPTGAGDTFAGGFVGYIQQEGNRENSTLRRATVCATALASFCCEDFSTGGTKNLTREKLEERIGELRRLADFS